MGGGLAPKGAACFSPAGGSCIDFANVSKALAGRLRSVEVDLLADVAPRRPVRWVFQVEEVAPKGQE
eukprot:6172387-Lingulodinium_polyedra.AAC.1